MSDYRDWQKGDEITSAMLNAMHADAIADANDLTRVTLTSVAKVSATWGRYVVHKMNTHGKFIPGLAQKAYALDYEKQGTYGTNFRPAGEFPDAFAKRVGATLATNASGWNVTNNVGEMRGIQIKDGVAYHDFENASGSPAGREGLAYFPDGTLRCVSRERGDTLASVLAAGAIHTWSYGPNLVVNGVAQDIDANPALWVYFSKNYQDSGQTGPQVSARQIIGQTATGDLVAISVEGKTNVYGIVGNDMVSLAVSEGLYNASTYDGGGSTQAYVGGNWSMPSSDDANGYSLTFRKRKVGDFFFGYARLATRAIDTGWINLPLASGYVQASASQTPQFRQIDDRIVFRGAVIPSSGAFGSSDVTIATVPQRFQNPNNAQSYRLAGTADVDRKVVAQADGTIQVIGGVATNAITLDGMTYQTDTIQ
jgi:hypothetical protein